MDRERDDFPTWEADADFTRLAIDRFALCARIAGGIAELARRCDLPRGTVDNWITKGVEPKLNGVARLASAMRVPCDWVVFGRGRGPEVDHIGRPVVSGFEAHPLANDASALPRLGSETQKVILAGLLQGAIQPHFASVLSHVLLDEIERVRREERERHISNNHNKDMG